MARQKSDGSKSELNKSEECRKLLKANPEMSVKDVVATLADRGIMVTNNLVYFVKGRIKGRKGRQKKVREVVARVATTTGQDDAVKTILKVKGWAVEVGGLKKLKALVDALSE
jgi:hypothetical protein